MKEEKESIFPFRRKSTNRLSLHLERKKDKKEDGQLKRASWSSFPLLRFSSSSSTSSSSSSSPAVQNKRGFGRKCNSSEEIKQVEHKNSPSKVNFQRGSNASIRSSVSTSSASSTASSVRTGGSSSITSILEGSGSDTFSCESYGGNSNETHNYPVKRTASEIIYPKRYDHSYEAISEGQDECLSLPSLRQDVAEDSNTSPKILYVHHKHQDVQHRSRKQLVQELETVRRTGSLPRGLEAHIESSKKTDNKVSTPTAEKPKPKHKKSFSFIHNSKFLGRLEARTRREEKSSCEEEMTSPYGGAGLGDKEASTSSLQSLVSLHHQEASPVSLRPHHQYNTPSQLYPPPPPPPPPPRLGEPHQSSPSDHHHHHHHHDIASSLHNPSQPQYNHESPSPSPIHHSPGHSSPSLPHNQYQYHHSQPVTITKSPPPPPPFLHQTDGQASPPQYSLAAFLNEAFGTNGNTNTSERAQPSPTVVITTPEHNAQPQTQSKYSEAFNPRYLETSFDSPSDFVIERNYANLLPEIRDLYHHVLFKDKEPNLPLSRSEYGDLELKQNFLGVIGDTIEEEEEEEEAESECEIGELLCQVDSTCFERKMEDKLEEMAGKEEEKDADCNARPHTVKEEGKVKANSKKELKLKLVKPDNKLVMKGTSTGARYH